MTLRPRTLELARLARLARLVPLVAGVAAVAGLAAGAGCARPSAPLAAPSLDVSSAPETLATRPDVAAASAREPSSGSVVRVRFVAQGQALGRDPRTGREELRTSVALDVGTEPPQRLQLGTMPARGCRLASDPGELDESKAVRGGLVCDGAGYAAFVRVAEDSPGWLRVTTYGQRTSAERDPPRERERRVGRVLVPSAHRLVFELVEPDAGNLP